MLVKANRFSSFFSGSGRGSYPKPDQERGSRSSDPAGPEAWLKSLCQGPEGAFMALSASGASERARSFQEVALSSILGFHWFCWKHRRTAAFWRSRGFRRLGSSPRKLIPYLMSDRWNLERLSESPDLEVAPVGVQGREKSCLKQRRGLQKIERKSS